MTELYQMFTIIGSLGAFIFFMCHRLEGRIDAVETRLSNRIDKLDEKLTDVDRRLCRMEGAFSSKDCCMLKSDHSHKSESA